MDLQYVMLVSHDGVSVRRVDQDLRVLTAGSIVDFAAPATSTKDAFTSTSRAASSAPMEALSSRAGLTSEQAPSFHMKQQPQPSSLTRVHTKEAHLCWIAPDTPRSILALACGTVRWK